MVSERLLDAAQPPCASLTLGMMWWTWLRHSSWGAVCNISTSSRGQGGAADGPEAPPERAPSGANAPARARCARVRQCAEGGGAHGARNRHLTLT